MKKTVLAFLLIIIYTIPVFAYSKPESVSVSDFSGIISDSAKNYINSKNDILYKQTEAKIIFVIVPSAGDMSTEDYCKTTYDQWGISSVGRNNSLFFLVNTEKNDYDFIVGNNINLALTDTMVYDFIIKNFEPYFKKEQYEKAFLNLYNSVAKWYESKYNNLDMNLDSKLDKYVGGNTTADKEKTKSTLWIWITIAVVIIILGIFFKIKHNVGVRLRKMERQKMRRKYKIDIDKITNS